ncbi:MAG TPA: hypothetical protein VE078_02285 [Thermoanaerobaculia bacterium]|nr:hypothetical protein [Thermoanaerobaculia bacterium]
MNHIKPWQPIAVILLAVVLWYMRKKKMDGGATTFAGQPPWAASTRPAVTKVVETPEVIYMNLRQEALAKSPERMGLPSDLKDDEPFGVLMEMAMPGDVVTLAGFADGDAGVYYKTGGGMKGGIFHDNVRKAAKEFVALSATALPKMLKTTSFPLPGADKVRFYILTRKGIFTTEAPRQILGTAKNDLSALFYSGQEVVAQMRQAQEDKAQQRSGSEVPPAMMPSG